MIILGIETSCDETAAAVVQDGTKILSNVVATSAQMHVKTGGIIPENAARQQVKSVIPVISEALFKAFPTMKQSSNETMPQWLNGSIVKKIDAIAVTYGPGFIGSLLVGVETAKTLSYLWKKPIVPVNHMTGHIYSNWLKSGNNEQGTTNRKNISKRKPHLPSTNYQLPKFPTLALVVSGGHTDLVLMKDHGKLEWIGGTRDDAAGEAFDKTARLLGLPYPGGPAISKEAYKFFNQRPESRVQRLTMFPRPMINEDNFDFSFSGLKTSVLRKVKEFKTMKQLNNETIEYLSAEIQEAIVDVLTEKSIRAIKKYKPYSFLLAGGVSANERLREMLHMKIEKLNLSVAYHVPPVNLCTDNAVYIASCAYFNYNPVDWKKVRTNPQLTIVSNNS